MMKNDDFYQIYLLLWPLHSQHLSWSSYCQLHQISCWICHNPLIYLDFLSSFQKFIFQEKSGDGFPSKQEQNYYYPLSVKISQNHFHRQFLYLFYFWIPQLILSVKEKHFQKMSPWVQSLISPFQRSSSLSLPFLPVRFALPQMQIPSCWSFQFLQKVQACLS